MKIGELAKATGLAPSAIRYYEAEGLLREEVIRRGTNNYREYSEASVTAILLLKKFQAAGFSIKELKTLAAENREYPVSASQIIRLLQAKATEIEGRIADLVEVQTRIGQLIAHKSSDLNQVWTIPKS
jgi:DNA-binding transcriptional MerR regulator